jgi:hypothetical protein
MVFITSNSERRLPEPFLRQCVYQQYALPMRSSQKQWTTDAMRMPVQPRFLADKYTTGTILLDSPAEPRIERSIR